ncbi:MAG TPA: hypothetical protein VE224_20325 [Pseudolabrys sp.]|nr:hypothetical protein [Pseudolabrys sp.]
MDPTGVLESTREILDGRADSSALREARRTLSDSALLSAIREFLRTTNDPQARAKVLDVLREIRDLSGDLEARRKNQLTNLRYGLGGGIALVVSSVIAVAASGGIFILPLMGGAGAAFVCGKNTGPLPEEERLYADINKRAEAILGKVDEE